MSTPPKTHTTHQDDDETGASQDTGTDETHSAGGIGFSISKLILVLIAILLVIIALLWLRSAPMPGLSDEIHLDEAHGKPTPGAV